MRLPRPTIGSAHVLAIGALVLAAGGGVAVAGTSAPAPTANTAYYLNSAKPRKVTRTTETLIAQLVVPAAGHYVATAKLDVSVPPSGRRQDVTCFLGAIGRLDRSKATVQPGATANLSLTSVGGTSSPGGTGTQAADLFCRSHGTGSYTISSVRMTALSVDATKTHLAP